MQVGGIVALRARGLIGFAGLEYRLTWPIGEARSQRAHVTISARVTRAKPQLVSITGSRPIRRASWRRRTNTRSPASAAKPFSKCSTRRPRSTSIGVFGNTPVVEAETR